MGPGPVGDGDSEYEYDEYEYDYYSHMYAHYYDYYSSGTVNQRVAQPLTLRAVAAHDLHREGLTTRELLQAGARLGADFAGAAEASTPGGLQPQPRSGEEQAPLPPQTPHTRRGKGTGRARRSRRRSKKDSLFSQMTTFFDGSLHLGPRVIKAGSGNLERVLGTTAEKSGEVAGAYAEATKDVARFGRFIKSIPTGDCLCGIIPRRPAAQLASTSAEAPNAVVRTISFAAQEASAKASSQELVRTISFGAQNAGQLAADAAVRATPDNFRRAAAAAKDKAVDAGELVSENSKEFAKSATGAVTQVGQDTLGAGAVNGLAASSMVVENSVEATREIGAGLKVASGAGNKVVDGSVDMTLGLAGQTVGNSGETVGKGLLRYHAGAIQKYHPELWYQPEV